MAMQIIVTLATGSIVELHASGQYAPDVMNDLQNRALKLITHVVAETGEQFIEPEGIES